MAPDYVLIPRSAQDAFVEAIKEAAAELRIDDALASDSYSSIVSGGHYKRLRSLMTRTLGNVVIGGSTDDEKRRITPTVYRDVKEGDSLLEGYVLRWISTLSTHIFPSAKFLVLFYPFFPWTTFGRQSSTLMPSRSHHWHTAYQSHFALVLIPWCYTPLRETQTSSKHVRYPFPPVPIFYAHTYNDQFVTKRGVGVFTLTT